MMQLEDTEYVLFTKTKNLIKIFMEPVIFAFIKNDKNEEQILPIIVGGAAADQYLKNNNTFTATHDFDIRLLHKTEKYTNWKLNAENNNKILQFAEYFAENLTNVMNTYIKDNTKLLAKWFLNASIPYKPNKTDFFRWRKEGNNLWVISWSMDLRMSVIDEGVVDIFPISNFARERNWQLEEFRSDPILGTDFKEYPIPTTKFFGISFASLGYVIHDLVNLAFFDIKSKGERNRKKYYSILNALNTPEGQLDCTLMDNYVNSCQIEKETKCEFQMSETHGALLSDNALLEYGIDIKKLPPSSLLNDIRNILGDEYICDYLKKGNAYNSI